MLIFKDLQKTLLLSIFGENRTHVKNKETRLRFFNIKEWNFLQKQEAEELKPYKKTSPRQKNTVIKQMLTQRYLSFRP